MPALEVSDMHGFYGVLVVTYTADRRVAAKSTTAAMRLTTLEVLQRPQSGVCVLPTADRMQHVVYSM